MLIIVTLLPSGRQVSPEVEGSDLVEDLRQQINELATPLVGAGVAAPKLQIIYFGNKELKDRRVLADYGILRIQNAGFKPELGMTYRHGCPKKSQLGDRNAYDTFLTSQIEL